jgi:outer membrane protein
MSSAKQATRIATTVLAVLVPIHVSAFEAGEWIVRAGVATVDPDEGSGGIQIPALAGTGAYAGGPIAGTGVDVDSDTQLGLTVTHMCTERWGVELLAATPFTHDVTADLGSLGQVNVGETSHLPPTVSMVWYPVGSSSAFSPYVGAGINYTVFFKESVSADLESGLSAVADAVTATSVGLPSPVEMDMKLDDSFGLAFQVGVDAAVNTSWHLNASVRWIDIDTEATLTSSLGETIRVDDIQIDPWVYQVNVGYRF